MRTLQDMIPHLSNKTIYYIGCQTAYICIASGADIKNGLLDEVAKDTKNLYKDRIRTAMRKYKTTKSADIKKSLKNDLIRYTRIYESFTRFETRKVVKTYTRKSSPPIGIVIILDGEEDGRFWLKEEFDNRHGKGVENDEQD